MDALIYEAETAAKLLTDLMEGPMDINTNDVLEVSCWPSTDVVVYIQTN